MQYPVSATRVAAIEILRAIAGSIDAINYEYLTPIMLRRITTSVEIIIGDSWHSGLGWETF
jgi:hypothetical protein